MTELPEKQAGRDAIPSVSVLMPVRNGAKYVEEAVNSILKQIHQDFEFIIIDDGSTDSTAGLLADFACRDTRIRVVHRPASGLVVALNFGLELCRAELVARMDADDIAMPGRLALQVAEMRRRPELLVLGGSIRYLDEAGIPGRRCAYPQGVAIPAALDRGNPMAHPTVMFRREQIIRLGGYRSWFRHCEDFDLWLRCLAQGTIDNLAEHLLDYRVHPEGVSVANAREQTLRTFVALGCHRLRSRGVADPQALPDDPWSALASLPLDGHELRRLHWSMLAHNAHLRGDTQVDPEAQRLWAGLRNYRRDDHARGMLALHHLRAARFYRSRNDGLNCLRNIVQSLFYAPMHSVHLMYRLIQKSNQVGRGH